MSLTQIAKAAVFLLVLPHNLVHSSIDDGKNGREPSTRTMIKCLRIPWMDGLAWITSPCKSSSVKEASEFIRAYESGEKWAVQKLEELQNQDVEGETYDECIEKNVDCTYFNATLDEDQVRVSQNETVDSELATAPAVRIGSDYLSPGEICTIIFLLIIGTFIFTCTICDFVQRYRQGDVSRTVTMLAKFSFYTNTLALLRIKAVPDTLPAIHGIRCLCFLSVIVAHRSFLIAGMMNKKINLLDILKWRSSWVGTYIWVTARYLDTFFLLASFLLTYQFLKLMKSRSKINLIRIYLHRYIRITPCLAVVMLLIVIFGHRLGSNPSWKPIVANVVEPCRESWWVNLLYLQNFVKKETQCLVHSWYLAVDMQLFWASSIILYPLHRWPKYGLKLLIFVLVASVVIPAYLLAINNYWNAILRLDRSLSEQIINNLYYTSVPYTRAFPYLLGMLLGYDVVTNKRRLSRVTVAINWVVAAILLIFCTWRTRSDNNSDFEYDLTKETVMTVLVRPSWSIAMAWIVYACTCGYGGVATRFFSCPIFLPLSRVSYCVYLISLGVQTSLIITWETEVLSGFESLMWIIFDLTLSFVGAFVLVLFFETPILVLEKIIISRWCQSKTAVPMLISQDIIEAEL